MRKGKLKMKKVERLNCKEISYNKFIRHINAHGFKYVRCSGGHTIFTRDKTAFAVPTHKIINTGIIWQFNTLVKNEYKYIKAN